MKKTNILALTLVLFFINILIVFADDKNLSEIQLDYFKSVNQDFKKNIDNAAIFDSKSDQKLQYTIENLMMNSKEAKKWLKGVYAVNPFFDDMSIRINSGNSTISLKNSSSYESSKVVELSKKLLSETVNDKMSNREKIKAIHDKLIHEISYDSSVSKESHTAGGALIGKKAVCDGYSRIFFLMAELEDIPVINVTSSAMGHAFNLVYVDDKWLLIDLTYNDVKINGKETVRYEYFLIDPSTDKYIYDNGPTGLSLDEYIKIGNYIYF